MTSYFRLTVGPSPASSCVPWNWSRSVATRPRHVEMSTTYFRHRVLSPSWVGRHWRPTVHPSPSKRRHLPHRIHLHEQPCIRLNERHRKNIIMPKWISFGNIYLLFYCLFYFLLILTVKIKTRHPIEGYFGSEFWAICNHCGVMAAWSYKTLKFVEEFLRFF